MSPGKLISSLLLPCVNIEVKTFMALKWADLKDHAAAAPPSSAFSSDTLQSLLGDPTITLYFWH